MTASALRAVPTIASTQKRTRRSVSPFTGSHPTRLSQLRPIKELRQAGHTAADDGRPPRLPISPGHYAWAQRLVPVCTPTASGAPTGRENFHPFDDGR